jgi:hypothetical protein
MSIRVGHIMRHEDVHGVSGVGKVADVFEATNGKCIVIWISSHSSVNVYDHVKDVETTHSHGGKTLVVWDYESPPDPDPMDAVPKKNTAKLSVSDDEVTELAAKTADLVAETAVGLIADKVAEKVAARKEDTSKKPAAKKPAPKKKA